MKVQELIDTLSKLQSDKDIFIDGDKEVYGQINVEPITESCEDPTVIGYIILEDRQLKLPFES